MKEVQSSTKVLRRKPLKGGRKEVAIQLAMCNSTCLLINLLSKLKKRKQKAVREPLGEYKTAGDLDELLKGNEIR